MIIMMIMIVIIIIIIITIMGNHLSKHYLSDTCFLQKRRMM